MVHHLIPLSEPLIATALLVMTVVLAWRARGASPSCRLLILAAGLRLIVTSRSLAFLAALVALAATQGTLNNADFKSIRLLAAIWFALPALGCWLGAAFLAMREKKGRSLVPSGTVRRGPLLGVAAVGCLFVGLWRVDGFLENIIESEWASIANNSSHIEFGATTTPARVVALEGSTIRRLDLGHLRGRLTALGLDAEGGVWRWQPWSKSSERILLTTTLSTVGLYEGGGCGVNIDRHGLCWVGRDNTLFPGTTQPLVNGLPLRQIDTSSDCGQGRGRVCTLSEDGVGECWSISERFQIESERVLGTNLRALTASFGCSGCAVDRGGNVQCSVRLEAEGKHRDASVSGISHAVSITSSVERACAIQEDGALLCWELDLDAQRARRKLELGARPILEGIPVNQVAVGSGHSCAVTVSGKLFCWGLNTWGQLGDGTTESRMVPVETKGIDAVERVSVGASVTCAVHAGGIVSCWGMRRRFND
jgi:hypothetical protein